MQIPDSTPRFRTDSVTCFVNKQHGPLAGTLRNIIIGKQWLNYNASLQQGSYKVADMREFFFSQIQGKGGEGHALEYNRGLTCWINSTVFLRIKKKFWGAPVLKSLLNLLQYFFCFYTLLSWPWGLGDPSSLIRDWTRVPCIGRWSLNRWTTREVPRMLWWWTESLEMMPLQNWLI